MLARLFEVRETSHKGRGLFAKEPVPKGTVVFFECQMCKRIPVEDIAELPLEEKNHLLRFGYENADGSHTLPCDEIIYLNHSCNANILDSGRGFDIVVRDIAAGEEATYDYRTFHDRHELAFACLCGSDICCGIVKCIHPQDSNLKEMWDLRVSSALKKISEVKQPLGGKIKF
jgi:SET domain-containing protein